MNDQCGSEMVGAVWVTEMSSPFLHLRELLKELGYKDTPLNLVADVSKPLLRTYQILFILYQRTLHV